MSCPVGYGASKKDPDAYTELEKEMSTLLPPCVQFAEALEACRRRVAKSGSGHCADESSQWTACRKGRERFEKHHFPTVCGGPSKKSFAVLKQEYFVCVNTAGGQQQNRGNGWSAWWGGGGATRQEQCLSPLKDFVKCASSQSRATKQQSPGYRGPC